MKYASLDAAFNMDKTLTWCGSVMEKCAEKKLSASKKLQKGAPELRRIRRGSGRFVRVKFTDLLRRAIWMMCGCALC